MKSMTFIEKQIGSHIRALRSDGEFDSHHLKDLCWEAGIKRELSVPYNPQQNGVAERKNRTICEAAQAMMHDLDLLPLFGQRYFEVSRDVTFHEEVAFRHPRGNPC